MNEHSERTTWTGFGIQFLSIVAVLFIIVIGITMGITGRFFPYHEIFDYIFTYAPLFLIAYGVGTICNLLARIKDRL